MKTLLKILGALLLLLALIGAGGFAWAKSKSDAMLARMFEAHRVDFPIPFPLDSGEIAAAGLVAEEAGRAAMERAVARGDHLVHTRYVCVECHGADFGGGVMIDDPMIGRLLGPNITAGEGGRTASFRPADWDRIVRHGIKPDGHPAFMPSEDFQSMSDQELSDIVAYIRSRPTVDATVSPPAPGPLGRILLATGQIRLSADVIEDHFAAHLVEPPAAEASEAFGRHLAGVCTGCHNARLSGGPVAGGDPSWPPSSNLTTHEEGLGGWTFDDFAATLRSGQRPDGTALLDPMATVVQYTSRMTDVELGALWTYLRSLPPLPTGG